MSFTRNREDHQEWLNWLSRSRDELIACSIPDIVLDDRGDWLYFLDHCYFQPEGMLSPILEIDNMSREDAMRLCLFLERDTYYPESSALNRLQYLLGRGRHAG